MRDIDDADAELNQLLDEARKGAANASRALYALIYEDLRRIAHYHRAGERKDHTLQTTALVHEAYLRLTDGAMEDVESPAHLKALASRIMRNVLIDYARRRSLREREREVAAEPAATASDDAGVALLDIDRALRRLDESRLTRLVRVVECKFFAGMTTQEAAGCYRFHPVPWNGTGTRPKPICTACSVRNRNWSKRGAARRSSRPGAA